LNIRQSNLSYEQFDTVFCPMADRWASATGHYSFRFFSPEQIDRILREGVKRGRTGSHDAIERILKHEPGLPRAALWRQIRRLKQPSTGELYQRTAWSPQDDQILRMGYEEGWKESEKRYANFLGGIPAGSLTRFGGGLPNSGWFGRPAKNPAAFRQQWTDDDNRILLAMAGYKTAEFHRQSLTSI